MSSVSYALRAVVRKQLADTITPVSIYLRLRDLYPNSFLLESTSDRPNAPRFSYICCDPIASFEVRGSRIERQFPDGLRETQQIEAREEVAQQLQAFLDSFAYSSAPEYAFLSNGIFGYMSYDCIQYVDELEVQDDPDERREIPEMRYHVFRYLVAIDHYKNELYLLENRWKPADPLHEDEADQALDRLAYQLSHRDFPVYPFATEGEQSSNFDDDAYTQVIETCKQHIQRGDVFQIVPSRRFSQAFRGDEFNVYRALRSINPSPYLFYFDYGGFKILGSSPEAQLVVEDGQAWLHPIAGTYRRTGDEKVDAAAVEELRADPKENAEHVMLVDLARNDLSKHCDHVHVAAYKEVQRYSHVIHLTSKIQGTLQPGVKAIQLLSDTFPMGTLSGAPKYRALQLIDRYERGRRRAYGGAIGLLGFDGSCNHAIVIRSFLSKGNVLYWQAGGGIVADSQPAAELQEIKNKLGALQAALQLAASIA